MKVKLNNVGVIKKCDVEFIPGINLIVGSSGSGKSTLMRSIYNTACNNFSDSDISFGTDSMDIAIEHNGNLIEYNRNTRPRCEHCSYKVNGETYVKLGRQSLPAVANLLKIGDICINGDDINFNFNLQFSMPFLIMGNQSTLYNVLIYRSTCDITSINEYYETDVKANASEINSSAKVRERLVESLEKLKSDAEKLKPIEDLYSRFISYKHENEKLSDISEYLNKLDSCTKSIEHLNKVEKLRADTESSIGKLSALIELQKYAYYSDSLCRISNKLHDINGFNTKYILVESLSEQLMNISKSYHLMLLYDKVNHKCALIDDAATLSNKLLNKEQCADDIYKLHRLFNNYEKCNRKVILLSKLNNEALTMLCEFVTVNDKMNDVNSYNDKILYVTNSCDKVSNELNKFDVCPLCGNHLTQCE